MHRMQLLNQIKLKESLVHTHQKSPSVYMNRIPFSGGNPIQVCQVHDKLVKRTLCITATSVPSEHLFSAAGELVSSKRSSLKPKNINMLLFCTRTANNGLINLVFGCFSFFFSHTLSLVCILLIPVFAQYIDILQYISTNISIL